MPEIDMFAELVEAEGEPEAAIRVPAEEADRYAGRLPNSLLRFWREHGRGSYKDGSYWICDPAPYQQVIEMVFAGDPEFDPAEMTAVGYTAFGDLWIWHRERYGVTVGLNNSDVYNPPEKSRRSIDTGERLSPDFVVGSYLSHFRYFDPVIDEESEPLAPKARARLGPLEHNEVYGFFPALALGGAERVENLQRVKAPEHMALLASLQPLMITRLADPEPGHPYGRVVPVRPVGPLR